METTQESESRQDFAEVDPLEQRRSMADEVRASLEAVRSAQAVARARTRRETRWARVVAAGALMAVGVTAWAASHRPPRARTVASSPAIKIPSVAAPQPAPPAVAPPREAPPAAQPASSESVASPRRRATVSGDSGGQVALCDAAFEQRSWTEVSSTCGAAFETRPGDGALAMRVAQAQHRRGHVADAADWARKALALDPEIPEAYVIVAHAEVDAGRAPAAADAYRRYLALAPRGWHATEARRALRAARMVPSAAW